MSTTIERDAIAFVVARLTGDRLAAIVIADEYRARPAPLFLALADLLIEAVRRSDHPALDESVVRSWLADLGLALLEAEGS
ncbi:MAG: hypothetical protein U0R50_16060 [Gaiellales bacterium]